MKDNTGKFKKIIDAMTQEFVSPADFKRVVDVFVKSFKDFKTEVSQNMASHMAEMVSFTKKMTSQVSEAEKRLEKQVTDSERSIKAELDEARQQLNQAVKVLNDSAITPPALDQAVGDILVLTKKVDDLNELRSAENIRNALEVLEGDERLDKSAIKGLDEEIEKIKSTARSGGGGTSSVGVAHAFKYISHTEAPVGDIDGVNVTYRVNNDIWWIAGFTLNGEQIAELPNFTYSGKTITFSSAIPAAYSGKDMEVKYIGT